MPKAVAYARGPVRLLPLSHENLDLVKTKNEGAQIYCWRSNFFVENH